MNQGNVNAGNLLSPTCDRVINSYVLSDVPSLHPFVDTVKLCHKLIARRT